MTICGQQTCVDAASGLVHWPTQTLPMCATHTERARAIANTLGFVLSVTELPVTVADNGSCPHGELEPMRCSICRGEEG